MNSAKMILACAAMSVAGATSADDDDSLRGVTGFFVKVDAIDADGAEMGLARDVLKTSVDAALKARGVTVLSLEEVNASTGSGHPGVLSLRIAVEKMPVGFAGFLQLRVFQEVLLRQGTYTVGATWHRDGQFTALSADRGRQLTMELITELLDGLAATHKAANARSLGAVSGSALNCKRWSMRGVRPSDDWPVAMAILRDPPDPKWSSESAHTRMASWKSSTSASGLAVFGVRGDAEPWAVALVSTSYRAPVSFDDVVQMQRRAWGEPSKCGADVKRFEFETRGCFWQDAWCDTWAMVTEASKSKDIMVVLGSAEGWSKYQAFIRAEQTGKRANEGGPAERPAAPSDRARN